MIPVVLSGGSGSRLWPISRQAFPKQFCEFMEKSLFNRTVERLKPLGSPWVVTVRELRVLTERSLRELGTPSKQVIYEPFGRNTAPAIALLCRIFSKQGLTDEVVGIFPADQLIDDEDAFRSAVKLGETYARQGQVVTLGVRPTYPATGYGYIETAKELANGKGAMEAKGFREKPNEETAREFLSRGGFFWNAGMFLFKVSRMIELLKEYAPDIWATIETLRDDGSNIDEVYKAVRATSIDYALMERLPGHVCIPCGFGWSDLGSWDAIAEVFEKQKRPQPESINVDSSNNFVMSADEDKVYAMVDVSDLIVVDTLDALLITKRGSTERVKEVVDELKKRSQVTANQHRFEVRPWGRFEVLRDEDKFKSKTIAVDPGCQLSYQSHAKRAEHWIIVEGAGEVVLNDQVIPVQHGSHVFIPLGAKHRVRNTGKVPLRFVEVQLGSYFGEDDIVRYEDSYGRS